MTYKGFIKKSRTLDAAAFGTLIDSSALIFLAYTPEQLNITVPVYFFIRMGFNGLQWWLRHDTHGPVGTK